jgi:hypothetical protein
MWEAETGRLWSKANLSKGKTPYLKKSKAKRNGDMAQQVVLLPSMYKDLSSKLHYHKKKTV